MLLSQGSSTLKIWLNTKLVTQQIDNIHAIASDYDVIVFDQWGVLHNGTAPYDGAITAIANLTMPKAVLSNSGKRAVHNESRITAMGFAKNVFDYVMTSGEALWRDIDQKKIAARQFFPIERAPGDAILWAHGLDITFVSAPQDAEAVLIMGLPDDTQLEQWRAQFLIWKSYNLPLYCSNPDRKSPRADRLVISPGSLAFAYADLGGETTFYGKPHLPVFKALEKVFGAARYLMVGDSMEHDIMGANTAGWDSLLVQGGLYANRFANANSDEVIAKIAAETNCEMPTYSIKGLR